MSADIFRRAEALVHQSNGRLTQSEALSQLSKRGAAVRKARKNYGVLHVTNTDRRQFAAVEQPERRFWWTD